MKRFEYVKCDYTGGGIYVYSALFNGQVWLYGGLDNYFGSFDFPGEIIERDFCCDYDAHWKKPSVPYPTWNEILASIKANCDESTYENAERILRLHNSNMNERCIDDETIEQMPEPDPHSKRLTTLSLFIEVFENFLEKRGIDIPNNEKREDEYASTIYGTDYSELSDAIEDLLVNLGMMEEE